MSRQAGRSDNSGRYNDGATAHRPDHGSQRQDARPFPLLAAAFALVVATICLWAPSASASQTRPYTGISIGPEGVAGSGSFQDVQSLAVDQSTGDLYVLDAGAKKVYRFDSSGEPLHFSSTGTNSFAAHINKGSVVGEYQIAVAPVGAPGGTAGDIYVASKGGAVTSPEGAVWIYAPSGAELGKIGSEFECGVAVDPAGHLLLNSESTIREYVPSTNPPTEEDFSQEDGGSAIAATGACNIAAAGTGQIYLANWSYQIGGGTVNPLLGVYRLTNMMDPYPTKIDSVAAPTIFVDPSTGTLLAHRSLEVAEYKAGGEELLGVFGAGQLESRAYGIAADASANRVYVGAGSRIKVFGTPVPVPSVSVAEAEAPVPSEAVLRGSVDPGGLPVTECFFEYGASTSYGHTVPCESLPPTNSVADPVRAAISGLETDGVTYHFRLVAANANGPERSGDEIITTAPTVVTEAAGHVAETSATLHGVVFPDGLQYSGCKFEYGLTTHPGFEGSVPCNPSASAIPADQSFHSVTANLSGLQANNATYRFRLVATNAHGSKEGATMTFVTSGEPELTEVRARDADQHSVTLEGKVDPRGYGSIYRIEWGPTSSYGTVATSGRVAAGEADKRSSIRIDGLNPGTVYHYRIVAASRRGTVTSGDREVETLDACGLPDGRCLELVSPRDVGPVASAEPAGGVEPGFQAGDEPGSFDFLLAAGLPDSTKGAQVLYHGIRGSDGWGATQVSPPIIARDETSSTGSGSSKIKGIAPSLSCSVLESNQPLTGQASTRLVIEAGGTNLYRRNLDGSYTAISELAPENLDSVEGALGSEYVLAGLSADCDRVVFASDHHYPGVGGAGEFRLYEWTQGTLRAVDLVPGPGGGEVAVEAVPGREQGPGQYVLSNVVSSDGSRIFFSAKRRYSPNPAEVGKAGIFVREHGTITKDVSLSETSIPDEGAAYDGATKDGSRVFFTANAGLTPESSVEGTDLYEYDLEDETLTDLSVDREAGGAQVAGFIGASEDGSHVYFVARGQLVPGKGGRLAENLSAETYSVYGEYGGQVSYVGAIRQSIDREGGQESQLGQVIESGTGIAHTSRVSPDGRYLIFESSADVTGYESGNGIREVYLYDADASTESTVCVSCRQDGKMSVSTYGNSPLPTTNRSNPLYEPQTLIERGGRPQVFFNSLDALAPGAVDGRANLYEWSHGQVFLIATEPAGLQGPGQNGVTEERVALAGADPVGIDAYFVTPQSLTWEDGDERASYYDARMSGGFPEPPPAPGPCEAANEGSCQGPSTAGGASIAEPPATGRFYGPGNPSAVAKRKVRQRKRHGRHHHKKKHKTKKHGNANGHPKGTGRTGK